MTDIIDTIVSSVQLGQLRPANTTAASIYTLPANTRTKVNSIIICNQSGVACTFRVFHDVNGTTYDETSALLYDITLDADTTVSFDPVDLWLENTSGNIAVRTSSNSAITFTMYGQEYQKTVTVN